MSAIPSISSLIARGGTIRAVKGRLLVSVPGGPTKEESDAIRQDRSNLIRALRSCTYCGNEVESDPVMLPESVVHRACQDEAIAAMFARGDFGKNVCQRPCKVKIPA